MVPRNSTPGGFAYIWQSKWVGIIAIKTERTQIHFLSNVLIVFASLDLKVPNIIPAVPSRCNLFRGFDSGIHCAERKTVTQLSRNGFLRSSKSPLVRNKRTTRDIHTFSPLALLIALSGLSTLSTRRILTTENCESLRKNTTTLSCYRWVHSLFIGPLFSL